MRWKRGNRLRLASEAEASPRTREIFAEVRERLGLPVVPLLYRAYAVFPDFLELHWQSFRPLIESRQFFVLGARLAAECYTRAHNYFAVDSLSGLEAEPAANVTLPLPQVLDYYQYLDPFLLLITAAQMQAFEGAAGESLETPANARHASFTVAPRLLSDSEATAGVQRIWEERRRMPGTGLCFRRASRAGVLAWVLSEVLVRPEEPAAVATLCGLPISHGRKRNEAGARVARPD